MSDETAVPRRPDRKPWISLLALFTSIFSVCISFGGLTPLIALTLEGRGTEGTLIGIVVAAQPVGTILAAGFVPRLLRRLGTADTIVVCGLVSVSMAALLPVFTSIPGWILLRFIAGLAAAGPWIVTETWINAIAAQGGRGRIVGLYGSVMAAGFVMGPILLTVVGSEGSAPFYAFAGLLAAALLPIVLTRGLAPSLEVAREAAFFRILLSAPTLFAAAVVSGVVDIAFFSFLPIWGLRNGLEESFAVTLLTVFVSGNIVLQYPLGWLGDRIGYRSAMVICGLVCIAAPALAPQLLSLPVLLSVTLFLWGGAAWGIYSIALAALGVRFGGPMLAAANAVFVIAYELANIAGPPVAGAAVDLWPTDGLMVLMGLFGVLFVILVLSRLGRPQPLEK